MKAQVKRKAHIPLPTRKREGGSGHPVAMPPQQKSEAGMAVQGLPVQAQRLTIGEPHDRYEQEADRVAAEVVQGLQEPIPEGTVQREVVPSLRDRAFSPVRRVGGGVAGEATPEFERGLRAARGGGQRLDGAFRARVEPLMGQDFGGVRVHTDGAADRLSRSIQAKAFTAGRDVFFAKGEYEPGSREGQGLLAHELTHVGQQSNNECLKKAQCRYIQRGGLKDFLFKKIPTKVLQSADPINTQQMRDMFATFRNVTVEARTGQNFPRLSGEDIDGMQTMHERGMEHIPERLRFLSKLGWFLAKNQYKFMNPEPRDAAINAGKGIGELLVERIKKMIEE